MQNSNNKQIDGESAWQRSENQIKAWIYTLMHELSQSQIFTVFLYKVLVITEALQFLWYAFHPRFTFLWDIQIFDWIRQVLKYTQFEGILSLNNEILFLSCLYIAFVLTIGALVAAIVVMTIFVHNGQKNVEGNSAFMEFSLKALSGYNLLLNTVFSFPFFFVFISTLICHNGDEFHGGIQCYQGIYFLHIALATIGMIILFITSVIFGILSVDLNPWSKVPYAAPGSRVNIVKLMFKIAIILFINLDYTANNNLEFCIIYSIAWFSILIIRFRQTPCYNKSVFNFILATEVTVFWASLVTIFHALMDESPPDNMGLLFFFVGIPPFIICYITLVGSRASYYRKLHIKSFKRDKDFEMYLLNIVSLIENRTDPDKKMSLEGLLKFHIKYCPRSEEECSCYSLAKDFWGKDEAPERLWYLWARVIILEGLEKFPKSARLRVLHAFIEKEKLKNMFKALFQLIFAQEDKPSLEEEFTIHTYKNIIEREMIDNDLKATESKGGIDVNLIVDFQNKFIAFQTAIENSTELHLDFWKELQEKNPEIQKLHMLGSRITQSVEETSKQYKELSSVNSNQIRMLQIYGNFLKDIVNDEQESQMILDKADYANKSKIISRYFFDSDQAKYGENSDACVVTLNCNYKDMGIVCNANNEITTLLGYPKGDIVDHNINRIMPKVLRDLHDQFLRNYFETSQGKIIGTERVMFPLNTEGYLVPCTLMIKVLPNLDEGVRLVGFICEYDENGQNEQQQQDNDNEEKWHYIMFDGQDQSIYGMTKGCKEDFGIPLVLINEPSRNDNKFTIESIFPTLQQTDPEELQSMQGSILTIDTKNLKENYMVGYEDSQDEAGANAEDKEKRYRSVQVRAQLFQDDLYQGVRLQVLRFTETINEHDDRPKTVVEAKTKELKIKEEEEAHKRLEEAENPEKSSMFRAGSVAGSVGSEMDSSAAELNEEIRLIKDFRSVISLKTTPRAIQILHLVVVYAGLTLFVLMCAQFAFKFDQVDEFQLSVSAINDAYSRQGTIAEINSRLRNVQLLARGILNTPAGKTQDQYGKELENKVIEQISLLRDIVLKTEDDQEALLDKDFPNVESEIVKIESLLQNGVKQDESYFSNVLTQYISHAGSAATSPLSSFLSPAETNSIPRDFYYVRRNGYGSLRQKSEQNALSFYQFFYDRTDTFDLKIEIIMIFSLVVLFIAEVILIPIILSVHKSATKVLALFGFISMVDISQMSERCESYMEKFLEDHKKQQNLSFGEAQEPGLSKTARYNDNLYQEVQNHNADEQHSIHPDEAEDLSHSGVMDASLDFLSPKNPNGAKTPKDGEATPSNGPTLKVPLSKFSQRVGGPNMEVGDVKKEGDVKLKIETVEGTAKKAKGQKEYDDEYDTYNERSQKLSNMNDNTKVKVFVQFILVGGLYLGYFLADYFHNHSVLENIRKTLGDLKVNTERQPHLRFLNGFTLEEIAEGGPTGVYNYTGQNQVDLRAVYKGLVLENLQLSAGSKKQSFPSSFNTFFDRYTALTNGNLCLQTFYYTGITQSQCTEIAGGLLKEGLIIVMTRIVQITDDILKDFAATAKTDADKQAIINSQKFVQIGQLLNAIDPILSGLVIDYIGGFSDYLSASDVLNKVKYSVFLLLELFVFVALWLPFKQVLKEKIFRTKGMLKMIPRDIIVKDERLKNLFLSGNILQAVR